MLSPISLSMLTGAGLIKKTGGATEANQAFVHKTFDTKVLKTTESSADVFYVDLAELLEYTESGSTKTYIETIYISNTMPAYGVILDEAGAVASYLSTALYQKSVTSGANTKLYISDTVTEGAIIRIDCYVRTQTAASIVEIEADKFAGYYYVEAATLFRDEATGKDYPAEFIIPRAKIQSNFTFAMAATGDPSTFSFTMDAFPGYTKFDEIGSAPKKVLAAIEIIDGDSAASNDDHYNESTEPIPAPQTPKA